MVELPIRSCTLIQPVGPRISPGFLFKGGVTVPQSRSEARARGWEPRGARSAPLAIGEWQAARAGAVELLSGYQARASSHCGCVLKTHPESGRPVSPTKCG